MDDADPELRPVVNDEQPGSKSTVGASATAPLGEARVGSRTAGAGTVEEQAGNAAGSQAGVEGGDAAEHQGASTEPGRKGVQFAADGGGAAKPKTKKGNGNTPGPGEYLWLDDVNLKKKPVWSMMSPDRRNMDLMLGTWTPASGSLQPRAPDPGEYLCNDFALMPGQLGAKPAGKTGVYFSQQWSWQKASVRPCLAKDPPPQMEQKLRLPTSVGGYHPSRKSNPQWSCFSQDRSKLPYDLPTWTPGITTDIKPGPGQYNLDRVGKKWREATTKRGCTWGGRGKNLHPEQRMWVPQTKGSTGIPGGEMLRLNLYACKGAPKTRCGCQICPGPGRCDHDCSPKSMASRGIKLREVASEGAIQLPSLE